MPILLTCGTWSFVFEDYRLSAGKYLAGGGKSSEPEDKKKKPLEFEDKLAIFYNKMEKEFRV